MAALSALKTEVLELSARLQNAERDRECAHRKLVDAVEEKERAQRRLESIGGAHEARITEMHCIIVELNRKLKNQQNNAIMEEHEPEGSGKIAITCTSAFCLLFCVYYSVRAELPGWIGV